MLKINPIRSRKAKITTTIVALALLSVPIYGFTTNIIPEVKAIEKSNLESVKPEVKFVNTKDMYGPKTLKLSAITVGDFAVSNWSMTFHRENGTNIGIGSVPCADQKLGQNAAATCHPGSDLNKFQHNTRYIARVQAKDDAGNTINDEHAFLIDTTGPNVNITTKPEYVNPALYDFKANATEDLSAIASWRMTYHSEDGKDLRVDSVPCQYTGDNVNVTCRAANGYAKFHDGEVYSVKAHATDSMGNESFDEHKFTVDTTAPKTIIHSPINATVSNKDTDVVATVQDENLRHYWINITRNGRDVRSSTVPSDSFENVTIFSAKEDGFYKVTLAARDKAGGAKDSGNRSDDIVVEFEIDKTPPRPTISISEQVTTLTPNLSGSVDSDVETIEIRINNGEWVSVNHQPGDTIWSYTIPESANLIDGNTYSVEVRATDKAGNQSLMNLLETIANFQVALPPVEADDDEVVNPPETGGDTPTTPDTETPQPPIQYPVPVYPPSILIPLTPSDSETQPEDEFDPIDPVTVAPPILAGPAFSQNALLFPFGVQPNTQQNPAATDNDDADADRPAVAGASDRNRTASGDEEGEVLSATDSSDWSIVNVILAAVTALMSLAALPGLVRNKENRRAIVRLLTLLPAIGGGVLLFVVENFAGNMSVVNSWSIVMAAIVVLQIIIVSQINKDRPTTN